MKLKSVINSAVGWTSKNKQVTKHNRNLQPNAVNQQTFSVAVGTVPIAWIDVYVINYLKQYAE